MVATSTLTEVEVMEGFYTNYSGTEMEQKTTLAKLQAFQASQLFRQAFENAPHF